MSDDKAHIKVTGYGDKKDSGKDGAKIDIYSNDPKEAHDSIHIQYYSDTGKGKVVEKVDGNKETTDIQCYLTSACMQHMQEEFDDNCYELAVLRWFRDKYVPREDVVHYYEVAPKIIAKIETLENKDTIYEWIYDNVVRTSVKAIHEHDYRRAYNRYKSSVIALEDQFVKEEVKENKGVARTIAV